MVSFARVNKVVRRIRPSLQADGGDVELIEVRDNNAKVRLLGKCAGCPSAALTLSLGLEVAIKQEIPEFRTLVLVPSGQGM